MLQCIEALVEGRVDGKPHLANGAFQVNRDSFDVDALFCGSCSSFRQMFSIVTKSGLWAGQTSPWPWIFVSSFAGGTCAQWRRDEQVRCRLGRCRSNFRPGNNGLKLARDDFLVPRLDVSLDIRANVSIRYPRQGPTPLCIAAQIIQDTQASRHTQRPRSSQVCDASSWWH